jgi:hypothetical protein
MFNTEFSEVNLGVVGAVKKPIYCGKLAVEHVLMALAAYGGFVERLEDEGKLFKKEPVVRSKTIGFNAFASFRYIGVAEPCNLLPIINSLYNRAKI